MNLIVNADKNWAIGYKGKLLVSIPEDMKFFRSETTGKVVVLGRKTLATFPGGLPLKNRTNIILTRNKDFAVKDAIVCHSVEEALELVGLVEFRKRLAKKYSLGMKQRLGLAGALIGRSPLLILDEPTNGLDPVGIHEIRELIRSLPRRFGCTVLVSAHLLPEVEWMADEIGILNHGKLLFEGTLDMLKRNAASAGYATENLEEMFLALIGADNEKRGRGK